MNLLHGVLLVCVLSKTINSLSSDDQKRLQKIREIWTQVTSTPKAGDENIYEFINRMTHGKMFNLSVEAHAILEKEGHHRPDYDPHVIPQFNCILENNTHIKAKTVHELTPYDIDIVAAFGDSLTAAFGANAYTPIDLFIEYHGVSWSIGGDETVRSVITLPNILREYNPNLKGYSKGISPPLIAIPNENLDVAVSGNTAYGLLNQAKRFVKKMLENPEYDFFGSWKVLTLFIGGNDLCSCCRWWKNYKEKYSPPNFINEVTETLDYLHQRVPKLFVNLVSPPNVTILEDLASPWCDFTHLLECKCGSVYGEKARRFTSGVLEKYQEGYDKLVSSGRYDTRDDFTVVLQPFFDHTIIPRKPDGSVDRSFFAPDCFHFSGKAHAASALALWNAMLEPVGKKVRTWRPTEKFHCPTNEHPYFYTRLNSGNHTVNSKSSAIKQEQETPSTSSDTSEKGSTFLNSVDSTSLMIALFMVILFTFSLVRFMTRSSRQMTNKSLSISSENPHTASSTFFSNEVKQLH